MTWPNCPQHGALARHLATGRLGDAEAAHADEVIAGCHECGAWWHEHLEGADVDRVDHEVALAFASFTAPRRTAMRPWLAAAAMVAVLLGGAVVMRDLTSARSSNDLHAQGSVRESVESANTGSAAPAEPAMFANGLESGDLAGWKVETAAATPQMFVDGMESGDLSAWSS